jgi:hypothetical protein
LEKEWIDFTACRGAVKTGRVEAGDVVQRGTRGCGQSGGAPPWPARQESRSEGALGGVELGVLGPQLRLQLPCRDLVCLEQMPLLLRMRGRRGPSGTSAWC